MGANGTHTHWGMVINNYTETDLALVQQGYPDHIRQLVYTLEIGGEEGTPHVQAFIKMKRDCRLTHMKKLFPRANFKYLESSEYKLHAQRYAQKLDGTADSAATITNGDPLHTIEGMVRVIIHRIIRDYMDIEDMTDARRKAEYDAIMEDYSVAKVFVGSTYKAMWKEFGNTMYASILHTHTHTHTQVVDAVPLPPPHFLKETREIGTQTDEWDVQGQSDDDEELQGSDEEDDDASGIIHEVGSDEDCEDSDCSSIGE